jgi:hypothetical protein
MISGVCFGTAAGLLAAVLYLNWPITWLKRKKPEAHPLDAPDWSPESERLRKGK